MSSANGLRLLAYVYACKQHGLLEGWGTATNFVDIKTSQRLHTEIWTLNRHNGQGLASQHAGSRDWAT